ncbi:MAG: hypothetical protein M1824_002364 [Vezdaea acicularis]|nr:MAG: hypothetical protein M1824_002364 [Vezdaea acicularis]
MRVTRLALLGVTLSLTIPALCTPMGSIGNVGELPFSAANNPKTRLNFNASPIVPNTEPTTGPIELTTPRSTPTTNKPSPTNALPQTRRSWFKKRNQNCMPPKGPSLRYKHLHDRLINGIDWPCLVSLAGLTLSYDFDTHGPQPEDIPWTRWGPDDYEEPVNHICGKGKGGKGQPPCPTADGI